MPQAARSPARADRPSRPGLACSGARVAGSSPAVHGRTPESRGFAEPAQLLPGAVVQVGSCCQSGTKAAGLPSVVAAVSNGHLFGVPLAIR